MNTPAAAVPWWHRITTRARTVVSPAHVPSPSWEDIRAGHHTAAAGYGSPLIKGARLTYGYLVWPAEGALLAARWIVHSPARLAVTVAATYLILYWM